MPARDVHRQPAGLRIRLGLTLALITGACVFGALEYRNLRLAEAHRQTVRAQLLAIARSFGADFTAASLADPHGLARRLRTLVRSNPSLELATLHAAGQRPGERSVASSAGARAKGGRRELRPLTSGRPEYGEEARGGRRYGELLFPMAERPGGRPLAVMELDMGLEQLDRGLAQERAIGVAIALLTALLAASLAGVAIERAVVRPLRGMWLATHRIARGRRDTRLRWTRPDELGVLARAFDEMADRLEESRVKLETLAFEDALTGLANLRAFRNRLKGELARAERERYRVAVVAIDLDHFKQINDDHGHATGDEALRMVARSIRDELRPSDTCGRIGGDEFMVALPRTDAELAVRIVERLRARVARVGVGPAQAPVTLSMGIAEFPTHSRAYSELMGMADRALYDAKTRGRDRFVGYSPETTRTYERPMVGAAA